MEVKNEMKDARAAQGAATQKTLRRQARKLFTKKGYSGANTEELVEKIEAAGAGKKPWDRLRAMCHAYLESCRDPALARMLVLEAPVVSAPRITCASVSAGSLSAPTSPRQRANAATSYFCSRLHQVFQPSTTGASSTRMRVRLGSRQDSR